MLKHTCELEDEAFPFPIDAANNRADPHPPLEQGGEVLGDSPVCTDIRQRHQPANGRGQRHQHAMLRHFGHHPPDQSINPPTIGAGSGKTSRSAQDKELGFRAHANKVFAALSAESSSLLWRRSHTRHSVQGFSKVLPTSCSDGWEKRQPSVAGSHASVSSVSSPLAFFWFYCARSLKSYEVPI